VTLYWNRVYDRGNAISSGVNTLYCGGSCCQLESTC